jgi:hypothetical protein
MVVFKYFIALVLPYIITAVAGHASPQLLGSDLTVLFDNDLLGMNDTLFLISLTLNWQANNP